MTFGNKSESKRSKKKVKGDFDKETDKILINKVIIQSIIHRTAIKNVDSGEIDEDVSNSTSSNQNQLADALITFVKFSVMQKLRNFTSYKRISLKKKKTEN